eukprot:760497-Prymnesium_polylepis.1
MEPRRPERAGGADAHGSEESTRAAGVVGESTARGVLGADCAVARCRLRGCSVAAAATVARGRSRVFACGGGGSSSCWCQLRFSLCTLSASYCSFLALCTSLNRKGIDQSTSYCRSIFHLPPSVSTG